MTILTKRYAPEDAQLAVLELYRQARLIKDDVFEGPYVEGEHHFIAGEGDNGRFGVYRVIDGHTVCMEFPDEDCEYFEVWVRRDRD